MTMVNFDVIYAKCQKHDSREDSSRRTKEFLRNRKYSVCVISWENYLLGSFNLNDKIIIVI